MLLLALWMALAGSALAGEAPKAVPKGDVDKKRKEHVASLLRLASLHEGKGDAAGAIETLLEARRLQPKDANIANKLLSLYDRTAEPGKKIPIYLERLKERPNDVNNLIALGTTYYQADDKGKAREYWEKALATAAQKEQTYRSLSAAYRKFSLHHEAVVVMQKGCETLPKSYRLHYDLGSALEQAKRHPEAIAAYEKALTLTTNASYRSQADRRLTTLYKLTNTIDEALERHRKRVDALRQELGAMYWRLVADLAAAGKQEEAQKYQALAEATGVPQPAPSPAPEKPKE